MATCYRNEGWKEKVHKAMLASSIFLVARKREGAETGSYEDEVRPELDKIVRERVDSLWKMGITGADLVIAAVGAGLRAFSRFSRVEYANGEESRPGSSLPRWKESCWRRSWKRFSV